MAEKAATPTKSPTDISAYDEETARLERTGQRLSRASMILRVAVRILNFASS